MSHFASMHQQNGMADDTEDCGTFQQQALEIRLPGANFDPNAVPTTGEEYLTLMAYERKRTPVVCVSRRSDVGNNNNVNMAYTQSIQNDAELAAHGREFTAHSYDLLPSDKWKCIQKFNFETTRKRINKMRRTFQPNIQVELPADGDSNAWLQFCRQYPPKLNIIFNIGQRSLEQLLDTFSEWLHWGEKPFESVETTGDITTTANVSATESTGEFNVEMIDENLIQELNLISTWLGQWLYAALACLHLPLEPGVHSTLREIARTCIRQRGRLPMPEEAKNVLIYNIFIFIIAKIFRQLDFAEFV